MTKKDFKDITIEKEDILSIEDKRIDELLEFLDKFNITYSFVYDDDNINAIMIFFKEEK